MKRIGSLLFACMHLSLLQGTPKSPDGFIRTVIIEEAQQYLCAIQNLKNQSFPFDHAHHQTYLQSRHEHAQTIIQNDCTQPEVKLRMISEEEKLLSPLYMLRLTFADLHHNPYSFILHEYPRVVNLIFERTLCILTGCHSGNQHDHSEREGNRVIKQVSPEEREAAIKATYTEAVLEMLRFKISRDFSETILKKLSTTNDIHD